LEPKLIHLIPCLLLFAVAVEVGSKPLQIDSLEPININGSKQWVLIRTANLRNPILLYLHGGPGASLIPFAHVATSTLTESATVVYWDQRGAGLSYAAANPSNTVNMRQLIEDTHEVTRYLKNRFAQEKIYLLGHSWGSTLGSLVIQRYPEDYAAYIGVGQVVNQKSLNEGRLKWLQTTAAPLLTSKDANVLKLLKPFQPVSIKYIRKYGGLINNISNQQLQEIMKTSPYCAEKYTLELYNKGSDLSWEMLWKEIETTDLLKVACIVTIPVYLFLGKYDYVTPTAPAVDYYNRLQAPYKEIVWFENSGHRMDVEEPEKFQEELNKILNRK
jgi:pimeloyl-ACP methyl ester carboxylesterase